jgi:hypothetical protein
MRYTVKIRDFETHHDTTYNKYSKADEDHLTQSPSHTSVAHVHAATANLIRQSRFVACINCISDLGRLLMFSKFIITLHTV